MEGPCHGLSLTLTIPTVKSYISALALGRKYVCSSDNNIQTL